MKHPLEICDLSVNIGDKLILEGINLMVPRGGLHAVMGPSANSSFCLSAFRVMPLNTFA